jgi:hypothetical protein
MGRYAPSFGKAPSDRRKLPSHVHCPFPLPTTTTAWPVARSCVGVGVGCRCRFRPTPRPGPGVNQPGPRMAALPVPAPAHRLCAVLPSTYVASVDHTELLRRSARCSVITARAHAATAGLRDRLRLLFSFLHVRPRALWLESRRKNGLPHPGREPRGCMQYACRRRAKRPSSSTRHQAGKRSGDDIAKGLSHLILVRLVTGEPRRHLEHKTALHKAASEVRYVVIFQQRQPHWA